MKIGWQLTEKSAKNMRSWLITFNVTLGIVYNIGYYCYNIFIDRQNWKMLARSIENLKNQIKPCVCQKKPDCNAVVFRAILPRKRLKIYDKYCGSISFFVFATVAKDITNLSPHSKYLRIWRRGERPAPTLGISPYSTLAVDWAQSCMVAEYMGDLVVWENTNDVHFSCDMWKYSTCSMNKVFA